MNPIDWLTHFIEKSTRWMTGVICCVPLLAGADENERIAESVRRGAEISEETKQRLATTIIPHVKLKDASIEEAVAFLRKELLSPDQKFPAAVYPVQFQVRKSHGFEPKPITLELKNTSAATVIEKVADVAGMTAKVNLSLVTFWPKPEEAARTKAAAFQAAGGTQESEESSSGDSAPQDEAATGSYLLQMNHLLDAAFAWIGSTTLRASLLAVVIVGLQLLLGRLIPPRWRYALWAPMLLVLVLPVLPKVPFGLFPKSSPAPAALAAAPAASNVAPGPAPATMTLAESEAPPAALNPYALIWLAGTAALLALGALSYRRNLRRIVEGQLDTDETLLQSVQQAALEVRLGKSPRVIVSTAVESPAVTGLIRPALLLPADFTSSFSKAEIRLILLHELTHLKRHDLLVNWLCCLVQALHWFNPVLWFAFSRMRDDRESACDAQVLSLDGDDHRTAYGHALLKLQSSTLAPALHLGFVGIFERKAGLKSRIRDISRHRNTHPARLAVSMSLIAILLAFGATEAQDARPEPRTEKEKAEKKDLSPARARIEKKLDAIMIPTVAFKDTSIEEAIDFVRIRSTELDKDEKEPAKRGINFVIRKARGPGGQEGWNPGRLTFTLKDASLRRILTEIAEQSGSRFMIDDFAITFLPKDAVDLPADPPARQPEPPKGKAIEAAKSIIIPVADFMDVTLSAAVEFLNARAKEFGGEKAPAINLGPGAKGDTKIAALSLRNVPLSEAVRYVAEATKHNVSADDTSIQIGK